MHYHSTYNSMQSSHLTRLRSKSANERQLKSSSRSLMKWDDLVILKPSTPTQSEGNHVVPRTSQNPKDRRMEQAGADRDRTLGTNSAPAVEKSSMHVINTMPPLQAERPPMVLCAKPRPPQLFQWKSQVTSILHSLIQLHPTKVPHHMAR